MKKKIVCVVGTRPEAIKMAPVITALRRRTWADVLVVGTGQHREMLRQSLKAFNITMDIDLDLMVPNQTLATITSNACQGVDGILADVCPDMVVVQGDTTTVLSASLAAFYRRVPLAHVEAGLRTHDYQNPFPEEMNRVLVGRLAKLHFAPTGASSFHLKSEGINPADIYVVGNTVIDALHSIAGKTNDLDYSNTPSKMLVTCHRRENFGAGVSNLCEALRQLLDIHSDLEVTWPVHPNPNVRATVENAFLGNNRVKLLPPADYLGFVELLKDCDFVVTDSGGVQEEAPALRKPVLVLRETTERPEAIAAGVASLIGTEIPKIIEEVSRLIQDEAYFRKMSRGASPYGDGLASARIANAIGQYFGYHDIDVVPDWALLEENN